MKVIAIIFSLFLFCLVESDGQKALTYNYVYKFQIDKLSDTSKFIVDTFQNQQDLITLKGNVVNSKSEPLNLLTIFLKSEDTTISTIINENGLFEIKSKPSSYELTITGIGYKTLTKSINIDKQNNFVCNVTLSTAASLVWYNIESSKKLSQKQIDKIKKCAMDNKQNLHKCRKKNEYFVTMEI